jgi:hypothetical protein
MEHDDLVPRALERRRDVRPDETGAADQEDPHGW